MRDLNALDIEYCRSVGGRGSPSEVLLTIWGSKGNTVLQLYNYLARIKMPNAMHCIRHLGFLHILLAPNYLLAISFTSIILISVHNNTTI